MKKLVVITGGKLEIGIEEGKEIFRNGTLLY